MLRRSTTVQTGYTQTGEPIGHQEITHRWNYDGYGRMTAYQDPGNLTVKFSHDSQGRITSETYYEGSTSLGRRRYEYTAGGSKKTIYDERDNKTVEYYDMNGNLLKTSTYTAKEQLVFTEKYSYDALDNQISITDAVLAKIR